MERIREAIKIAKRSRDGTGERGVLGARDPIPRYLPGNPEENAASITDGSRPALEMIRLDAKHLEQHRIVGNMSDGVGAIPFDILRTKVIQEMHAHNWSILVVTSPTPGCGKTVTAINLALSMAKLQTQIVYLVDMDFRKPNVANYLGIPRRVFLNDYLNGQATAEETLFNVDIGGGYLNIACNANSVQNPSEVVASQQVADFLSFLKARHEKAIIILDLPPLLVSDDVMSILPLSDCCLLTVAENMSTRQDIENSSDLLRSTNFLGCVHNKTREINKNYNYY